MKSLRSQNSNWLSSVVCVRFALLSGRLGNATGAQKAAYSLRAVAPVRSRNVLGKLIHPYKLLICNDRFYAPALSAVLSQPKAIGAPVRVMLYPSKI